MSGFDYENYGLFKEAGTGRVSWGVRLAKRLGLKNRYIRFFRGQRKDQAVIEIGCGNGSFLRELMLNGFSDVRGIEPSPSYQRVVPDHLIEQCYAADGLASCKPESVGMFVALDVFEHIRPNELSDLLKLIERCLEPEGRLLIRVPNMASPLALPNYFGDISHTTPLNQNSLRQLLFDAGLQVDSFHPEPFAYPRSLMMILGILFWPFAKACLAISLSAFGIQRQILTPNLVCLVRKVAA